MSRTLLYLFIYFSHTSTFQLLDLLFEKKGVSRTLLYSKYLFIHFSHVYFPASGQAVVTGFVPSAKESWCRMLGGKGRRGISFAWRQHRFFFDDFLLLALSDEKLEGDRKGEGVRAWGWGEAHRVRFTLQHCCCALFWTFTYGTLLQYPLTLVMGVRMIPNIHSLTTWCERHSWGGGIGEVHLSQPAQTTRSIFRGETICN